MKDSEIKVGQTVYFYLQGLKIPAGYTKLDDNLYFSPIVEKQIEFQDADLNMAFLTEDEAILNYYFTEREGILTDIKNLNLGILDNKEKLKELDEQFFKLSRKYPEYLI